MVKWKVLLLCPLALSRKKAAGGPAELGAGLVPCLPPRRSEQLSGLVRVVESCLIIIAEGKAPSHPCFAHALPSLFYGSVLWEAELSGMCPPWCLPVLRLLLVLRNSFLFQYLVDSFKYIYILIFLPNLWRFSPVSMFQNSEVLITVTLEKEKKAFYLFLAWLDYEKCVNLLGKVFPLPPNSYSLYYKCSAQVISFELQFLLYVLAAVLFRRSQPTGLQGFLARVHLQFSWQLCLFMHLYFSLFLSLAPSHSPSPSEQSDHRTGLSSKLAFLQTPLR